MALDKKVDNARPKPVDVWETPQETWEFVTLPDEDPLGKGFPTISLNKDTFEPGKKYLVPPQVASYINERIKVFNRSCVRLLQPNADMKSIGEVNVGSAHTNVAGHRAVAIDGTGIQTL